MADVAVALKYECYPLTPTPDRAGVLHTIAMGVAKHENVFTDYERLSHSLCSDVISCAECAHRVMGVHRVLLDPQAMAWEVWNMEKGEVIGLIYLTQVVPGCDALAHYVFFDGDLAGKTELLKAMMRWCFEDHDGWRALKRLSVMVPDFAFALARHAVTKLGFGGDYKYEYTRTQKKASRRKYDSYSQKNRTITIPVEGVKRNALRWAGRDVDVLILGKLNG